LLQIDEGEVEPAAETARKKPLGVVAFLKEAKARPQYFRFAAAFDAAVLCNLDCLMDVSSLEHGHGHFYSGYNALVI
ncbi:MAG: hypothetical protein Q8S19_01460, partial [Bacillota bacterium]|nr:hypothetical protein [Bacillota bacterium]